MADIRNRSLTLADCRFDWTMHGFENIFEGESKFSDIDAVLNYKGYFMFIEHKFWQPGSGKPMPKFSGPQRTNVYEPLAEVATCLFIAGDTNKSIPWFVEIIGQGVSYDWTGVESFQAQENLRQLFREWRASIDEQKKHQ